MSRRPPPVASTAPALPTSSDQDALTLRERARTLAQVAHAGSGDVLELVEFQLAGERYGLETRHVEEVHVLRDLTPLPCTPTFVLGLVNLRGRLISVIDLKKFFEMPERGINDLHRVLVLRSQEMEVGILADTVDGVTTVERAALQPSLPTLQGVRADYLIGVTAAGLVVLDGMRILADPRIVVDESVDI